MIYERIDESPQFDGPTRNSHEARYRIAAGFVEQGSTVLDAGCGVGYGAKILCQNLSVTYFGIDKNPPAGRSFYRFDFEKTNEPIHITFDVFVGLEIIEHLDRLGVQAFIMTAHKARKWIIVSTPIVPNSNPYHKQQFTESDMHRLFAHPEWEHYQTFTQGNGTYGIFIFKRI